MANVLIADDNPHAQRIAEQVLRPEGHLVVGVSDGQAALESVNAAPPDVLLLDTKMPGLDGFSVCRELRLNPALASLQVVMLAGPLETLDESDPDGVGFNRVLKKPLDAGLLLEAVNGAAPHVAAQTALACITDPLAELVEETLAPSDDRLKAEVREATREVLETALPAIIDRVAEKVAERLKRS